MRRVGCTEIASQLQGMGDMYLLLVSEGCPFCKKILDKVAAGEVPLAHETVVVNTDACIEDIDKLIDWPATPMIAHFKNGKELRRAVGMDKVLAFDRSGETAPAVAAAAEEKPIPAPQAPTAPETPPAASGGDHDAEEPMLLGLSE